MKKIILFLVTGILIMGCSSDEGDCCTAIDPKVSIKYINEEGENLFEIEKGFTPADINIYHKINNEWSKFYVEHLDYPKGFMIIDSEDGTYLAVFTSRNIIQNSYSETKIEFSKSHYDILKTELDRNNSNEIMKVWYNNELKWEGNQTPRKFEIIK